MTVTISRPERTQPPGEERLPAPPVPDTPPEQVPIRISRVTPAGMLSLFGAFLAAIALTWVLYERVLPLSGALGFWLCTALMTLVVYAVVCWDQWDAREVIDRVSRLVLLSSCVLLLAVVLDLIGYVTKRGTPAIVHGNFWTQTMAATGPLQPLTSGGMVHALVGSLEQLGIATLLSVPLGVAAAVYLVEIGGAVARVVRIIVEAMTALPEIVAGLFIYALFILTLGQRQSGLAAALALTVMMIPVVTRTSEVILRLVPGTLSEASYALGASQASTMWRVVLPTARSGLSTAVILAMARAVGETSPVLLTAGFTKDLNANPFSGAQTSLPLYIFTYVRYPQPAMIARAFGAGLALMIMVLVLFVLARVIGGKAPGELSARQQRRLRRHGPASDAPRDDAVAGPARNAPTGPNFDDVPVVISPGFPDPPDRHD